jgi:hypothetical protein
LQLKLNLKGDSLRAAIKTAACEPESLFNFQGAPPVPRSLAAARTGSRRAGRFAFAEPPFPCFRYAAKLIKPTPAARPANRRE